MTAATALDPLRPIERGRYHDERVAVVFGGIVRHGPPRVCASLLPDGRILVEHGFTCVDDDLAERLSAALRTWTDDPDVFSRAFVGVVLTTGPAGDPLAAWERFYRASLARFADPGHGGYVEIYRHALELLPRTSVLDLGCGFGFLSLHLARLDVDVLACEPGTGSARLLASMSGRLGSPVDVVPDLSTTAERSVDAVALLHVLEHVDDATGRDLLRAAMRVARQRVVVAVPYEDVPTALYGHVRSVVHADLRALGRLGARSGWQASVHDHAGGWLVLDRPSFPAITHPSDRFVGLGDSP